MIRIFLLTLFLCTQLVAFSQTTRSQYRFAQTYFGIQTDWLYTNKSSALDFSNIGSTRLLIGGTHFWGKADFYVSFPLFSTNLSSNGDGKYSEGTITGARYLPFKLRSKWPTPFIGAQWIVPRFSFGEGPVFSKSRFGLELGITKVFNRSWTLELGGHYVFNQKQIYPTSRIDQQQIHLPNWGLHLALKKYFDFTASFDHPASKKYVQKLSELMEKEGGLSTWSIAIGPSAAIPLSNVPFNSAYPFIGQRPRNAVYVDLGVGYYFHKWDAALRLTYGPRTFKQQAYDLSLEFKQRMISFEAFKFLFDYKGFVPFIGGAIGKTHYDFEAIDEQVVVGTKKTWKTTYGLIFGWDIRPVPTDWVILRTNLRYFPAIDLKIDDQKISFSQLEFNFIQVVFYPERFQKHRKTQ